MALITLIAAIGKNGELGKDNNLIWKIKEDLDFFKEATINKKIVMGKNTFLSLPKMLNDRVHIILTTSTMFNDRDDIIIFHTFEELNKYLETLDEEVMIIGGASIYEQFIDIADKMLLTIIDSESEADVYFPQYNNEEWDITTLADYVNEDISYTRKMYLRK